MGFLTDWLKEIPLSAVLKERLAGADAKYDELQSKHEGLQKENSDLRELIQKKDAEIADLKKLAESLQQPPGVPRWGSQPRIKGRMEQ